MKFIVSSTIAIVFLDHVRPPPANLDIEGDDVDATDDTASWQGM